MLRQSADVAPARARIRPIQRPRPLHVSGRSAPDDRAICSSPPATVNRRPTCARNSWTPASRTASKWGLIVREMDNPVLGQFQPGRAFRLAGRLASGAANGDRLPLLVYRVNVDDGQEELVRGALLSGTDARARCAICWASATTPPSSPSRRARTRKSPARRWAPSARPTAECPAT